MHSLLPILPVGCGWCMVGGGLLSSVTYKPLYLMYIFNRDYTRPDLPTCESDIVAQPSASGPVMPDISAAIAGKYLMSLCTAIMIPT